MIKLDLKLMKLPLVLYLFTVALLILMLLIFPDFFCANERNDGVYESTAFYFLDFIFPFLSSVSVIVQIGGTFEPRTYDFICSLPIKTTPIIRWLRSVTFFAVIQLICVALTYYVIDIGIGFGEMCYICFANALLFLSLAFLITLLVRHIFYVFCILYGYMFIDLTVGDNFFKDKSLFVNIFAIFTHETVFTNRSVVYCIAIASVTASILIMKFNLHNRLTLWSKL